MSQETTLADLKPDPKNARRHNPRNIGMIVDSLHQVGAWRSVAIDEDNVIRAGNGVWEAAAEAGIHKVKIVDAEGDEIIAVRRKGLTEEQKAKYALFDNRTAELAEWDPEILAGIEDVDLGELFFDSELAELGIDLGEIGGQGPAEPEEPLRIEQLEELVRKWNVEPGCIWIIHGEATHCVACGDSEDEAFRDTLSIPEGAALIYDPNWDATPLASFGHEELLAFTDGYRARDVIGLFGAPAWVFAWDGVTSWYTPNRPLKRAKLAFWYGDLETYAFDGAHYGEPDKAHEVTNTRGTYSYTPDPRGKHLSDVFQFPLTRLHSAGLHPYEKPLDWVRLLIGNCFAGRPMLDPYLGSGASLVACEQLGQPCCGIEIVPGYVGLALERVAALVGAGAIEVVACP